MLLKFGYLFGGENKGVPRRARCTRMSTYTGHREWMCMTTSITLMSVASLPQMLEPTGTNSVLKVFNPPSP